MTYIKSCHFLFDMPVEPGARREARTVGRVIGILAIVAGAWMACEDLVPGSPKVVQSRDGLTQVVVPASWREQTDLNEEADIQVANLLRELYVIVLSESKQDFDADTTLEEHSEATRSILLEELRDGRVSYAPGPFRIGGYPAVQYQLRGSVDKIKIVYFHTTVEGPNSFHQIVGWTLLSRLTKNESVLQGVIRSLRVRGATSSHAFAN